MNVLNEREIQEHVTMLGWIHIVANAFFLVLAICAFALLPAIGAMTADTQVFAVLSLLGSALGLLMVIVGLPGILAGYGLLKGKTWARYLALVIGVLSLANFPLGTIVGVYTLWVLLQQSATAYFDRQRQPA